MQNIPSTLTGPIKDAGNMYSTLSGLFGVPGDSNLDVWKVSIVSLKEILTKLKCESNIQDLQFMVQTSDDSSASGKGTVWLIDPASYTPTGGESGRLRVPDAWIVPSVDKCRERWGDEAVFDATINCQALLLQTNSKDLHQKLKKKTK